MLGIVRRSVRLTDVAQAAGVSQGTASNVFNRPEVVRPEVRARVEEAARRLGYGGPDPRGRLLRAGKVNAIRIVIADELSYFFCDPFARLLMAGIAEVCDRQGAGMALVSGASGEQAAWSIETALVDGFLVHCLEQGDRLIAHVTRRGLPFVAIDLDAGPASSSVRIDDGQGARLAAQHVLGLGHRSIAIASLELRPDGRFGWVDAARLAGPAGAVQRDRMAGYRSAMVEHGVAAETVRVMEAPNDRDEAALHAEELLAAAPTAVLCMSDVLALAVMDAAARRGLRVPADLSVVGFDDIPEALEAGLTTIAQPIQEKGRRAAELLFSGAAPRGEVLPVRLVERGSTGPPRAAG